MIFFYYDFKNQNNGKNYQGQNLSNLQLEGWRVLILNNHFEGEPDVNYLAHLIIHNRHEQITSWNKFH